MDRFYRILCAIGVDTTLPEDLVVNTWHFRHSGVAPGTTPQDSANDMIDQLEVFYQIVDGLLFPSTVGNTITCKAYDLAESEPRVPVLTRNIAIVPNVGEPFPHEVAFCMSMRAAVVSGAPPARRRGRVYLGPCIKASAGIESNRVLIPQAYRQGVVDAAVAAFSTGLTGADPKLHIYSRTTDELGASLAGSFFAVETVRVDNAVDIQRRRGQAATAFTQASLV